MATLFAAAIFLSAALLFWLELMVARMVLPRFGGGPAVWNTCVLFFEALLLLGYGYAHLLPARLGVFAAGLVLHGRLARARPDVPYLTEYFFWVSLGGVLGGMFNGLVAPWPSRAPRSIR